MYRRLYSFYPAMSPDEPTGGSPATPGISAAEAERKAAEAAERAVSEHKREKNQEKLVSTLEGELARLRTSAQALADRLTAYEGLGTAADISKKVKDAEESSKKVQELEAKIAADARTASLSAVWKAAGFNADAATNLLGRNEGLAFEVKTENGKPVPYVEYTDGSAKKTMPLTEYVKQQQGWMMPSLTAGAQAETAPEARTGGSGSAPRFVPAQPAADGAAGGGDGGAKTAPVAGSVLGSRYSQAKTKQAGK